MDPPGYTPNGVRVRRRASTPSPACSRSARSSPDGPPARCGLPHPSALALNGTSTDTPPAPERRPSAGCPRRPARAPTPAAQAPRGGGINIGARVPRDPRHHPAHHRKIPFTSDVDSAQVNRKIQHFRSHGRSPPYATRHRKHLEVLIRSALYQPGSGSSRQVRHSPQQWHGVAIVDPSSQLRSRPGNLGGRGRQRPCDRGRRVRARCTCRRSQPGPLQP